jgi:hypothetical protein
LEGLKRSIEDKGQSLASHFAMENRIQKPMLPAAPPDLDAQDLEQKPQSTSRE